MSSLLISEGSYCDDDSAEKNLDNNDGKPESDTKKFESDNESDSNEKLESNLNEASESDDEDYDPSSTCSPEYIQFLEEEWTRFAEVRAPQPILPWKLERANFKKFSHEDPPKLHFGVTAEWEDIVRCAKDHDLKDFEGDALQYDNFRKNGPLISSAVLDFLMAKCHCPIRNPDVFGKGPDVVEMFAIYDNYNVDSAQGRLSEKAEEFALATLKQELGVQNQQPMWWWDAENGIDYTCPLPEYNPEKKPPPPLNLWSKPGSYGQTNSFADSCSTSSDSAC